MKAPKNISRKQSTRRKAAWKQFSRYIRLKYSDKGYCKCVTCNKVKRYKDIHSGHYIPQGSSPELMFDERNVHPQCTTCNLYRGGEQALYGEFIARKYGRIVQIDLVETYKARKPFKRLWWEYYEIEKEYKEKADLLKGNL